MLRQHLLTATVALAFTMFSGAAFAADPPGSTPSSPRPDPRPSPAEPYAIPLPNHGPGNLRIVLPAPPPQPIDDIAAEDDGDDGTYFDQHVDAMVGLEPDIWLMSVDPYVEFANEMAADCNEAGGGLVEYPPDEDHTNGYYECEDAEGNPVDY